MAPTLEFCVDLWYADGRDGVYVRFQTMGSSGRTRLCSMRVAATCAWSLGWRRVLLIQVSTGKERVASGAVALDPLLPLSLT
mmetsp:Transcript_74465/g.172562  ORF Transcript_74465/g.172562 Transcript_74465/m.172562 type:complete len:82 (+) Transcript_74465:127-372(+)